MGNIDLKFDMKNMGVMFWVPIAIILISIVYFIYITTNTIEIKLAFPVLEFIIVPFSCWWIIYLYYDYYDRGGLEILLSYPLSNAEHGLLRIVFFTSLYGLLSFILFTYVSYYSQATFKMLALQYIPQYVFFSGLGFLLMTICRNSSITITILAFYVTTEFLTKGQLIPWYHVFYMNEVPLSFYELINKSILNFVIGLLFINLGGYCLRIVKTS